jgi:hypothetical protein
MPDVHALALPGCGCQGHASHKAEPVAAWLGSLGLEASVVWYRLNTKHPGPLGASWGGARPVHLQRPPRPYRRRAQRAPMLARLVPLLAGCST